MYIHEKHAMPGVVPPSPSALGCWDVGSHCPQESVGLVYNLSTRQHWSKQPGTAPVSKHRCVNVGIAMPFAPSPSHHHFYGWYVQHQKWVVYGIAIPTLQEIQHPENQKKSPSRSIEGNCTFSPALRCSFRRTRAPRPSQKNTITWPRTPFFR